MSTFLVTVRQPGHEPLTRTASGTDSAALIMAAQDEFGPCSVSVKPA
jgi:hypothetical protein